MSNSIEIGSLTNAKKSFLILSIIFISLQANGQQAQDTLYLKNGDKAVGKLIWQSKRECRFQTSEGLDFTFTPDDVERIVTQEIIMKRVNPDTLNAYQLNLYLDKAVKMRNTGRALTLSGLGLMAAGFITGVILINSPGPDNQQDEPNHDMGYLLSGFYIMCFGGLVGIPCTLVGIPLWSVGGSRKAKVELTLMKFDIKPVNSMAPGVGISLRF